MADRLGAVATEPQLAVQLDPLPLRERALLLLELERDVEEPLPDALGRHRFGEEREVVAEHEDRAGIVDLLVLSHELLEKDRRHRRHILVAEPDVGDHKPLVSRLDGGNADPSPRWVHHPMAGDDLLAERHGPARSVGRREDDFPLEPGDVEVEQPAVLDDAARDLALALGEGCERNRLAAPHSVDDREVGSGEYSQILAILPVDPLDVLGDDQLDAGAHLGVRRLLPRRALAAPLAADRRHEATALHRSPRDRELLAAFQAQEREPALPPVSTAAMDAHLRYLSDDLLEGRAPGTRGGRLAAQYIAAQFQALGLAPAEPDGSYFQPVALVGLTPHPSLVWGTSGAPQPLKPLDDFVAWAERPEPEITADGDVVFLGYGIQAPEWHWDDYKDVSVRGKVLLLLVNDPGLQDSTVFNGRALTYYGRWTYKLEEAARHGVLGVLLIHTTASATYPWEVVRGSWSVEQFKLDRAAPQTIAFAGWVTADAARAALARAGFNLDSLTRAAARRDFRPVPTGLHVAVDIISALRRVRSENVVAKLPGSDPRLASQVVLFTSHWDHRGIGPAVNGDSIYNGAEDNGSGVAAMLAAAQALSHAT